MSKVMIAPSILSADFSKMGTEVKDLEQKGADMIHCDVMDGVYVPNITFGIKMVADIKPLTALPLDVHLMIIEPEKYVERFIKAGADIVSFHPEASNDAHATLATIKANGAKAAIVLNPDIDASVAREYIGEVDMILLMSVFPGFGGQKFIESVLDKIVQIDKMIKASGRKIDLEIDGGITVDNVKEVIKRGVNVVVAGNTVFKAADRGAVIKELRGN